MENVEVDTRGVVHQVRVMLTGEDVSGPAHVSGQLIDFIEATIDPMFYEIRITKVADDEIVSLSFAKAREFEIYASNPKAFTLESLDQVVTDEAPCPTHQCNLTHLCL